MRIFDDLATAVAFVLEQIHNGLSQFLPSDSGWAWGLSIVLLTITVRILVFPLFVKQIKSQRRMAEIAPKVKDLQAKHKGDRETLNVELMKLYKDHGTNPISGCLPMLLQLPIFFALFKVMNEVKPHEDGTFHGKYGLSDTLIGEAAHAKIFGAPIAAAFNSGSEFLDKLGAASGADVSGITVKIVAALMVITMGLTTFITQKQMMARSAGQNVDPQMQQVQKIMLYVLPFSFAIFGFSFPIGVLLYWLTTNVWSMGQQHFVIKRMPPVVPGVPAGKAPVGTGKGKTPAGKDAPKGSESSKAAAVEEAPAPATAAPAAPRPTGNRPGAKRQSGSRKNKRKRR